MRQASGVVDKSRFGVSQCFWLTLCRKLHDTANPEMPLVAAEAEVAAKTMFSVFYRHFAFLPEADFTGVVTNARNRKKQCA